MKNFIEKITIVALCFPILFENIAISYVEEIDSRVELICNGQTYVNDEDLSSYIVEVKHVKLLSCRAGIRAVFIEDNEPDGKEPPVYYAQTACGIGEDTSPSAYPADFGNPPF